ncbi:MAG: MOSC domain-containing protein [Caldilineaceae bacterium]
MAQKNAASTVTGETATDQPPHLYALFVGQPKTITDERGTWTSAIYRDRVTGPVSAQQGGLVGDKVAQPYHGGPDADICIHLLDHYRFWNTHYGMALQPGYVGENFTLDGISEEEICVGDLVRVGSALIQVSGPRVPCANLARRIGRADWVKLTIRENRTGCYASVVTPGVVQPGDGWLLQERLNPDGSIPAINRCLYLDFDPVYAQRMQEMQGLAAWWKELAAERLANQPNHWTTTMKE